MKCPQCDQELAEQAGCSSCDWKASPVTAPVGTFADEPEIAPAGVSNEPPVEIISPEVAGSPPPDTDPAPARDAAEVEPPPPTSSGVVSAENTTLNALGNNILIGQLNAQLRNAEQEPRVEERALYDFTSPLPKRSRRRYRAAAAALSAVVERLKEDRLIFISCAYAEYALDAAYEATEGLNGAGSEQNRIISYESIGDKNLEFSVRNLLEHKPEVEGDSVVLVDALNTSAEVFPDSILGNSAVADTIKQDLRTKNLFLVVVVNLAYVRKKDRWRHEHFLYWEIPFLQYFLRQHYPDEHACLEEQIAGQRERGGWERDESVFCQQVFDYHDEGRLRAVVEGGGPDDPEKSARELLAGSGPVQKTVLYAAAFFQEITPPEFCRVVEALLAGRTASAPPPTNGADGSGAAHTQAESSLCRLWEEEKDDIFTELLRDIHVDKDASTVVGLYDASLREPLRRLFEKRYRYYVIDQFKTLQERGIFFYPSLRVAENTVRIAIDMACRYPDEFNEGWVVGLIDRLRKHFNDGGDSMFQFLPAPPHPGALHLAFTRISEVFRRTLETQQLEGMVHNSLEHFIKCGYHEETLLLINQLQFSPEFDELYWFKQLLHRADADTRRHTYYSLYSYLKRMGSGVYEGLKKVEAWLPKAERDPATYSPVDYFTLRLLVQYCLETLARFNPANYGEWPSRYPLFAAAKDSEAAGERASLLARWLLHPGIQATLNRLRMGSTQMALVGALLAEWSFILLGEGDAAHADKGDDDGEYSAAMLLDLLVTKFVSETDLSQRLELLKYWNKFNHDLIRYLCALPPTSELKFQLNWKRELVARLIARVKGAAVPGRPTVVSAL